MLYFQSARLCACASAFAGEIPQVTLSKGRAMPAQSDLNAASKRMRFAANDNRIAIAPRGLRRVDAAAYISISPSLFDSMVQDGRMPSPRMINTRTVWDRYELDEAFETLPRRETANPWDDVANASS
jgi:predicted DNA-binding transcriptional regulator AlpA